MIKANELRIGNYVGHQYWNPQPENEHYAIQSCIVCALREGYALVKHSVSDKQRIKMPYENISPILLTKEILLANGFQFIPKMNDYAIILTKSQTMNDGAVFSESFRVGVGFSSRANHITYSISSTAVTLNFITDKFFVHNLQNVVFVLTGEELELKL